MYRIAFQKKKSKRYQLILIGSCAAVEGAGDAEGDISSFGAWGACMFLSWSTCMLLSDCLILLSRCSTDCSYVFLCFLFFFSLALRTGTALCLRSLWSLVVANSFNSVCNFFIDLRSLFFVGSCSWQVGISLDLRGWFWCFYPFWSPVFSAQCQNFLFILLLILEDSGVGLLYVSLSVCLLVSRRWSTGRSYVFFVLPLFLTGISS